MTPAFPLSTERLTLRRAEATDTAFIVELVNDPGWLEYIGDRGIHTTAAALTYIEDKLWAAEAQHGYAMGILTRRDSGQPVGAAGFLRRDFLPHPDIGYALLTAHAGQGYATEICHALMAQGRSQFGFSAVLGLTSAHNTRSLAVLRKIGLTYLRTEQLPGWSDPSVIYST